jgi:hypothetical protein
MEDERTQTSEEHKARNAYQVEIAKVTKKIAEYREDPQAALDKADVAPHLAGRG